MMIHRADQGVFDDRSGADHGDVVRRWPWWHNLWLLPANLKSYAGSLGDGLRDALDVRSADNLPI